MVYYNLHFETHCCLELEKKKPYHNPPGRQRVHAAAKTVKVMHSHTQFWV